MVPDRRRRRAWRVVLLIGALLALAVTATSAPAAGATPRCDGTRATIVVQRSGRTTRGTAGPDVIYGTTGRDVIEGRGGRDVICGRGGRDTLRGGGGYDRIFGGGGNDDVSGGNAGDDLFGAGGEDDLYGNAGNDLLKGGPDDDTLAGLDGDDILRGEGGNDTLSGDFSVGGDTGAGDDRMYGGDGNDLMAGSDGDDELYGEGGNDTLNGGPDSDRCEQGPGSGDIIDCEEADLSVDLDCPANVTSEDYVCEGSVTNDGPDGVTWTLDAVVTQGGQQCQVAPGYPIQLGHLASGETFPFGELGVVCTADATVTVTVTVAPDGYDPDESDNSDQSTTMVDL